MAEEIEEEKEVRPYQYFEATISNKVHHFYITCMIGEPSHYADMVNIIRGAGPNDIVYLHLNTPGGNITTGVQIISAMRSTQAHVIASIEGEVSSLGTILFLSADEFIVHDDCIMMFHNYSGGTYGKGHEQLAQVKATAEWFNSLAERAYLPFMSEEELHRIIQGEDIYMLSPEIRERLENMVAVLEKEKEEEEKKKEAPKSRRSKKSS